MTGTGGLGLSEAIRLARQHAGLAQWQLAERLGVRQAAVSSWETGRTAPTGDHLAALAAVFGLDVGRLVVDAAGRGAPRGREEERAPQAQSSAQSPHAEGRHDAPGPARPVHQPPPR